MKVGGEPLQQEFNRGYDFILNTYGSAENIIPGKNDQQLIQRGIVIEIDFDIGKNYRLASAEPPFSIYNKKQLYVYIREATDLPSRKITKSLKKIKVNYGDVRNSFIS